MPASHHGILGVNLLLHAIYCEGIATGVFHSGTSDGTAFGQGGEGGRRDVWGDAMCAGDVRVP